MAVIRIESTPYASTFRALVARHPGATIQLSGRWYSMFRTVRMTVPENTLAAFKRALAELEKELDWHAAIK